MFDPGAGFLYNLLKDVWRFLFKRKRKLSPSEVVALRAKWKPEIEGTLLERRTSRDEKRRFDVIIRDMDRIDVYPDIEEDRPWWQFWNRQPAEDFRMVQGRAYGDL